MKFIRLLPLLLLLTGCRHQVVQPQVVRYVVTPDCVMSIEKTNKTQCSGPDPHHLTCTDTKILYKTDCGHWDATGAK